MGNIPGNNHNSFTVYCIIPYKAQSSYQYNNTENVCMHIISLHKLIFNMLVVFNNIDDDYATNSSKIRSCLDQPTVVLVWAEWCPHCHIMKGDWERIKNDVDSKLVNIVEIESGNLDRIRAQDKALFKKLYPQSNSVFYPMIKTWKNKKGRVYSAPRNYSSMKEHIDKQFTQAAKPKKTKATPKKASTAKVKKTPAKQTGGYEKIVNLQSKLDQELRAILDSLSPPQPIKAKPQNAAST